VCVCVCINTFMKCTVVKHKGLNLRRGQSLVGKGTVHVNMK